MNETDSIIDYFIEVIRLTEELPNDQELGNAIRKLIKEFQEEG
jgi:hypothetical protein